MEAFETIINRYINDVGPEDFASMSEVITAALRVPHLKVGDDKFYSVYTPITKFMRVLIAVRWKIKDKAEI